MQTHTKYGYTYIYSQIYICIYVHIHYTVLYKEIKKKKTMLAACLHGRQGVFRFWIKDNLLKESEPTTESKTKKISINYILFSVAEYISIFQSEKGFSVSGQIISQHDVTFLQAGHSSEVTKFLGYFTLTAIV